VRRFKSESVSYNEARSRSNKLLTNAQESVLIEYIRKISNQGMHATPKILENIVVELVRKPVGGRWIERFIKRYENELASVYLRSIDQSRHIADNSTYFEHYFTLLQEKIEKYHIKPSNIYNFDEKGFLLGICRMMKRIVPIDRLKNKKILGSNQDGSREFISLLATISADGTALPPALIYQGDSYDLQSTWIEDFDHSSDEAFFAVSKKGWTNEELGFSWLSRIFEPFTREKAGNARHLLIVDGHSSHVNMKFINFCGDHGIILGILPPHSGLDLIIRATEKLVVKNDILEHENKGLRAALVDEKKRRKKGKAIGLFPKDKPGEAIFFSPAKIAAIRTRHEKLESQKAQEKLEKETERQNKAVEKEKKLQEAQIRRENKKKIRAEKVEQKQREKEARITQKELTKQAKIEEQLQKSQTKQAGIAQKRKQDNDFLEESKEHQTKKARNGRTVTLPNRFIDKIVAILYSHGII